MLRLRQEGGRGVGADPHDGAAAARHQNRRVGAAAALRRQPALQFPQLRQPAGNGTGGPLLRVMIVGLLTFRRLLLREVLCYFLQS